MTKASRYNLKSIAPLNKKFKVNHACLRKKSKNIQRERPDVSYYHFIAKCRGKFVSRALNVIIEVLTKYRSTLDIFKTNQFITKLKRLNTTGTWKNLLEKSQITFLELDIKEQYKSKAFTFPYCLSIWPIYDNNKKRTSCHIFCNS